MAEHGLCALVAAAMWAEALVWKRVKRRKLRPRSGRHLKKKRRTFNTAAARPVPREKMGWQQTWGGGGGGGSNRVLREVAEAGSPGPRPRRAQGPRARLRPWRKGERVQARLEGNPRWANATVRSDAGETVSVVFADAIEAVAVSRRRVRPVLRGPAKRSRNEKGQQPKWQQRRRLPTMALYAQQSSHFAPEGQHEGAGGAAVPETAERWSGNDLQIDASTIGDSLCTGSSISGAGKGTFLHVANLSGRPVALAKGAKLGTAYPVQVIDCSGAAAAPAVAVGDMDKETAAPNEFCRDDEPLEERVGQANFGPDAPPERVEEVKELIRRFPRLVSNKLRQTHMVTASIPTKPGCSPAYTRPYRMSKYEREVLDKEVDRMVAIGALEESTSAWCSPMLLVSKKPLADGSSAGFRCVSDFRELNARLSHIEQFPLPDVREMLESLEGSTVFSACDALHGFWGIPVRAEDRHKLAFQVGDRNLQYKVLPMGVASSSAIFQKFTTATFARCPHTPFSLTICWSRRRIGSSMCGIWNRRSRRRTRRA